MLAREDFEEHSCWYLKRGRAGMTIRWRWEETSCFMDLISYESVTDRGYRKWDLNVPTEEAYDYAFGCIAAFAAKGMPERIEKARGQDADVRLVHLPARFSALPHDVNPWQANFGKGIVGAASFFTDTRDESRMIAVSARESQYDMSKRARVIGCARGADGDWRASEVSDDLIELGVSDDFSWPAKAMARYRSSAPRLAA
jgi:hypothetical protein